MVSPDLVSVSWRVSRSIFASFGLEGFRSPSRSRRFQVSRLWILQNNGFLKFLYFNYFLLFVFSGKKQPKHVGKTPEIKKNDLEVIAMFFKKISAKCISFEVSSLGLELHVSVSEFLMKSQSRSHPEILTRFRSRSRRLRSRLTTTALVFGV